jgi:hypothetical protein
MGMTPLISLERGARITLGGVMPAHRTARISRAGDF